MKASLRALLAGVLDYAGLFPPAALLMEDALRQFSRYRREPEAWMLGRFVCPVADLEQIHGSRRYLAAGDPWSVAFIGRGGATAGDLGAGLLPEHRAIENFVLDCEGRATAGVYEVRVPVIVTSFGFFSDDPEVMAKFTPGNIARNIVKVTKDRLRFGSLESLPAFIEAPATDEWRALTPSVVDVLAEHEARDTGFKLRCGGSSVPSAEQVAFTIVTCRDARVPLKFTAGLHQPLRHGDDHGFVNVFAAATLAHARGLNEEQVRAILEEENASNFIFDDNALRWGDHSANIDEIIAARQWVPGFGSCSFNEPRDGLEELGWLP
jgi:hypothetical protein